MTIIEKSRKRFAVIGLVFLAAFICFIDRVAISVAAVAMQQEYSWSETTKGIVLSSFFVGYMIFMMPSGWLANRIGGRQVLGWAVLSWSLLTIVTPIAAAISLPILLLARVAMGAGEAGMFPAAFNLIAGWIYKDERSRATALIYTAVPIGTLFALMTAGLISDRWGWPAIFYLFGSVGIFWCVLWFLTIPSRPPALSASPVVTGVGFGPVRDGQRSTLPWRVILRSGPIWTIFLNAFSVNWVVYLLLAWLPSYFRIEFDMSLVDSGFASAAPWLTMFVCGNLAGILADRLINSGVKLVVVRRLIQCTGMFGAATFLLLVRVADSPLTAIAAMCGALGAISLAYAGVGPNHLEVAPRHSDILISMTNTIGTVPGIVAISITGWLVDQTGTFDTAFGLTALIAILAGSAWAFFSSTEPIIE